MEHTSDESQNMALGKDGSGLNQLPDSMGFQNVSDRDQVSLGQIWLLYDQKWLWEQREMERNPW